VTVTFHGLTVKYFAIDATNFLFDAIDCHI